MTSLFERALLMKTEELDMFQTMRLYINPAVSHQLQPRMAQESPAREQQQIDTISDLKLPGHKSGAGLGTW